MKNKTNGGLLFSRALKLAVDNITRNKILSIATVFVIATIIFIFNIIIAVNFIAKDALNDLNKKLDITVYLKDTTTTNDVEKITSELQTLEGVENVKYISKDEALEQVKKTNPNLTLSFEKYKLDNPLPASLSIATKDPTYQQPVRDQLLAPKYQTYFTNIAENKDASGEKILSSVSQNLINVSNFTYQIVFWMVITFVVGGTLIILNAIQMTVHTRKKEIGIMKLVGAPYYFIRLPFILESIIYALLSAILSFIMLFILSQKISVDSTNLITQFNSIEFYKIFLAELLGTVVIAVLSSLMATDKYLQKTSLENS